MGGKKRGGGELKISSSGANTEPRIRFGLAKLTPDVLSASMSPTVYINPGNGPMSSRTFSPFRWMDHWVGEIATLTLHWVPLLSS